MTAAFTPAAFAESSPETEAYHYGRAAAYDSAATLTARLPGVQARELATAFQANSTRALEASAASYRARVPELAEDETEDERATVVLDGLRAALGGPGAWEADPAFPGALIGEIGGVLVRVQAVAP